VTLPQTMEFLLAVLVLIAIATFIHYRTLVDRTTDQARLHRQVLATVVGILVAPAVTAAIFTVPSFLMGLVRSKEEIVELLEFPAIVYMFAFTVSLVVGIPSFIIFARFKLIRWWTCAIVGLVAGVFVEVAFFEQFNFGPLSSWFEVSGLPIAGYGISGALAALCFWFIWTKGQRR
jgi:hypothetical protein